MRQSEPGSSSASAAVESASFPSTQLLVSSFEEPRSHQSFQCEIRCQAAGSCFLCGASRNKPSRSRSSSLAHQGHSLLHFKKCTTLPPWVCLAAVNLGQTTNANSCPDTTQPFYPMARGRFSKAPWLLEANPAKPPAIRLNWPIFAFIWTSLGPPNHRAFRGHRWPVRFERATNKLFACLFASSANRST